MSLPNPIVLLDARARYVHPACQMSRASTKTVFDAAGRLVTAPPNAIGWMRGGYLSEPQRTNMLLHSNDLTQGAWVKSGATVAPAALPGPDGAGMGKLVEDGSNGLHRVQQPFVVPNDGYATVTCLCRPGERDAVFIEPHGTGGDAAQVDFSLHSEGHAQVSYGSPHDYTIKRISSGLYRVYVTLFWPEATSLIVRIGLLAGGTRAYQGDGTSGAYIGYVQGEMGARASSYIETAGSTASRSSDWLRLSQLSSHPWWGGHEGTFVCETADADGPPEGYYININNEIRMQVPFSGPGARLAGGLVEGAQDVAAGAGKLVFAIGYDGGEVSAVARGQVVRRNLTAPITANATIGIGNHSGNDGRAPNVPITRVAYYPQRLSDADLQSLTAIQE